MSLQSMMATLDPFELIAFRAIRQALMEALPEYWERRAQTFDAVGTAEANQVAYSCRCHAWLLRNPEATDTVDHAMVDAGVI